MPTAGNVSQFLSQFPVPSIIQSPGTLNDPSWLRCDGSIVTRTSYPALSAAMSQVGVFTPVSRALAATPSAAAVIANGVNVVAAAPTGASGVQYSGNSGVTWSAATTPASFQIVPNGLVNAGTKYFALGTTSTGAISTDLTGSGTWTASTSLTGSPTTCATNGSGVILAPVGSSINYSSNSGASFTQYSITGSTAAAPIVYTGTTWVLFCSGSTAGVGLQTSTTGLVSSWTAQFSAPWSVQVISNACSDGAGNILAVILGSSIAWVSSNSGASWRETLLPAPSVGACSYANGRWFVPNYNIYGPTLYADGSMSVSSDLLLWVLAPSFSQASTPNTATVTYVAYSGGNYVSVNALAASVAVTNTENTAQLYLPRSVRSGSASNVPLVGVANWQEWIKAA